MSNIDGKDTYLLIALDERRAYPGGATGVSFDASQTARLGKLVKAELIVQNRALPTGVPYWRLTDAGVAFLEGVAQKMEALVERMSNDE